jgi:hypothetical protein
MVSFKSLSLLLGAMACLATAIPALPKKPTRRTASPHRFYFPRQGPSANGSGSACGPVAQYFNPTRDDWDQADTDGFFIAWNVAYNSTIQRYNGTGGLTAAFSQYAAGDPLATCKSNGEQNCNWQPCGNPALNSLGNCTQPAYYVLQSMENLHNYFDGLQNALQVSAITQAFQNDNFTKTFYVSPMGHDADDVTANSKGVDALKEIINGIALGVAAAATFVSPEFIPALDVAKAAASAGRFGSLAGGTVSQTTAKTIMAGRGVGTMALFGVAQGASSSVSGGYNGPNDFGTTADVASYMGQEITKLMTDLMSVNDKVFNGDSLDDQGTSRIGNLIQGGTFLNASINEVDATSGLQAMLMSMAINQLWKANKVFIMGGGQCGDNQGIGNGPQNATWCDPETNTAWYLYFWQDNDVISLTSHQWGWVVPAPGSPQLGQGTYANISLADAIQSSVKAYQYSGFEYTVDVFNQRMANAIQNGSDNPLQNAAATEGVFTIPVCNISQAINNNYQNRQYILQDYGHESRPNWCGPICNNDLNTTKAFISAANMVNFKSPYHMCSQDPGYSGGLGK